MDNNFQKPANEVNFGPNDSAFGKDVEKVGKEVAEKKEALETKHYSEKDLIKQHVGQMVYPQAKPAPQQVQKAPATQDEDKFLPDYLKEADPEIKRQVERLLEITIRNGLEQGIKEAQKMPPFILDAYHDALIDKLHDELVKRKII